MDQDTGDSILAATFFVSIGLLIVFISAVVYRATFFGTSGKIDYCWVDSLNNGASSNVIVPSNIVYRLNGHIDWRSDERIGVFPTFDEAVAAAKKIDCPLHAK